MAIVRALQEKLAIVQAEYDGAMKLKADAEAEAKFYSDRLDLATRLLTALGSENERWGGIIIDIQKDIDVIVGNVLMASAFISYIGPFSKTMRDQLVQKEFLPFMQEMKIPMSAIADPIALLTDEATKAKWNS
jgi:dynein heavy chain